MGRPRRPGAHHVAPLIAAPPDGFQFSPYTERGCKCGREAFDDGTCIFCGHGPVKVPQLPELHPSAAPQRLSNAA